MGHIAHLRTSEYKMKTTATRSTDCLMLDMGIRDESSRSHRSDSTCTVYK